MNRLSDFENSNDIKIAILKSIHLYFKQGCGAVPFWRGSGSGSGAGQNFYGSGSNYLYFYINFHARYSTFITNLFMTLARNPVANQMFFSANHFSR
jgi:hypothetical protein